VGLQIISDKDLGQHLTDQEGEKIGTHRKSSNHRDWVGWMVSIRTSCLVVEGGGEERNEERGGKTQT